MNNAVIVCRDQRISDLPGVLQCIVHTKRAHGDAVVERLTLDVLHDQEVRAVLVADIVQGADVGMVETGNGVGFTTEARQPLRITGEVFRKDLDGDGPSETGVGSLVDFAHPARTDLADDLIWAQARARCERQWTSLLISVDRCRDDIEGLGQGSKPLATVVRIAIGTTGDRHAQSRSSWLMSATD